MALQCHFGQNLVLSTGRHSFKHNDAARLIRAVEAAGKTVTGVTLKDGVVTVLVNGEQPSATGSNDANSWNEILENDSDKDRAS